VAVGLSSSSKVRVCQNRDCCRQWKHPQNLPETLQDLLSPDADSVEVEITGCLSQCGKGPNLLITHSDSGTSSSSSQLVQGVTDPVLLSNELKDRLGIRVSSKLVAAVTVMGRATQGSPTATTFEEKERYLTSVIQVLRSDPLLRTSTANMRCHVMRAQVRCEYGMPEEALRDLSEATVITNNNTNRVLLGLAWRTRADCYRALGQMEKAEEALREWAENDPSRRTKAMKEIQEIQQQRQS